MHRLTARLLLLFALTGTFAPLALAAAAAAPHACCIRKAHHCHESAVAETDQLSIRSSSCCDHNCCRAATVSQWASPQPALSAIFAQQIDAGVGELQSETSFQEPSASRSTRAPPSLSIA
jgi:hypothetical protein